MLINWKVSSSNSKYYAIFFNIIYNNLLIILWTKNKTLKFKSLFLFKVQICSYLYIIWRKNNFKIG